MAKQSVTVSQYNNPKLDATKAKDDSSNPEHVYHVEKTVNTLTVKIGEYLTPARVQGLIDAGIDVTIIPVK